MENVFRLPPCYGFTLKKEWGEAGDLRILKGREWRKMGRGLRPPRNPKPKEAACFPSHVDASGHEETPPRRGTHSPHNFPLRRHKTRRAPPQHAKRGQKKKGPDVGTRFTHLAPLSLWNAARGLRKQNKNKEWGCTHSFRLIKETHFSSYLRPFCHSLSLIQNNNLRFLLAGPVSRKIDNKNRDSAFSIGTEDTVHPIPVCKGILS